MKFSLAFSCLVLFITFTGLAQDRSVFNEALKLHEEGKYESALLLYKEFLKSVPNDSYTYYNLGLISYDLYGIDSALFYLNQAEENYFPAQMEVLDNYKKYGAFITNQYLDELLRLKGVSGKNRKKLEVTFTREDSLKGSLRPERTCFDVGFYNLTLTIDSTGRITGNNEITFEVLTSTRCIQLDLNKNLSIQKVLHEDKELEFRREKNAFFINFPSDLSVHSRQKLKVFYSGYPKDAANPPWEGGFVRKLDEEQHVWIGVACEHIGSSFWWPGKDHLSDEPDSVEINLTVPEPYYAVSNGTLISVDHTKKGVHYTWKVANPINTYNVTFYLGNYKTFEDTLHNASGVHHLDYYVLPYHLEKAKSYFKQTKQVIKFYEKAFGEYPFWNDGFGMVESPYAGMEHQGAIAYGSDFGNYNLFRYNKATYDYIIVHEAAHEWWGNSVSIDDMADLWIHEGFATYAEMMFIEDQYGYQEYLDEVVKRRKYILNLFPMIGCRGVNDNTAVGSDIYHKGVQVLHNLRCTLSNDSLFYGLIKSFALKHQKSIVSNADFVRHVSEQTGKNFAPFFSSWLMQRQIPVLEYKIGKDEAGLVFSYRWTAVENGFEMPFGCFVNGKAVRRVATTEWKQEFIQDKHAVLIPTGWNPIYKKLPLHACTYFAAKEVKK